MAEETYEEESLISQEDIDRLLDASSFEEAEENLSQPPEPMEDDLGELSQEDIDQLMGGGGTDSKMEEMPPEDDAGELSQDDIDRMMNGGGLQEESEPETGPDDVGELSQEDIDRMMNATALENDPEPVEDAEELELISQEDIQRLMNASPEDAAEPGAGGEELELISQEDINGLMTDTAGDEPKNEEAVDLDDDSAIDESEAVDVAQTLITQETIDRLIKDRPAPGREDSAGTEEPGDDSGQAETVILDGEPEDTETVFAQAGEELPETSGVEGKGPGPEEQALNDVTQEDIDSLLQGTDDDEDFLGDEEDILISQDDIDTLLLAADQEDEDVLGDLMDGGVLDEFDTQDLLDGEEDTDQVVLEGAGEISREEEEEPSGARSSWFRSRLVIAGFSILLVLGIMVPCAYFLFGSKDSVPLPEKQPVPTADSDSSGEPAVVSINVNQLSDIKKSGSIILTDFLILTSGKSRGMAYVQADIAIDYTDQRAFHEINDNLPFYRDLIFESIQKNLVSEKESKVTKSDLIWEVENTLKKVLPPQYIERVSFKTFKTS